MLLGSKAKPIFVALGTAAVLTAAPIATVATLAAADTAPSTGSDPAPDPSVPADTTSPDTTPTETETAPAETETTPPATTPPATTPPATTPPATTPPVSTPPATTGPADRPGHGSPSLSIRLAASASVTAPGGAVAATAWVSSRGAVAHNAVLSLSAPGAEVAGSRGLGDIGSGGRSVSSLVRIPGGHGAGTVTVTATIRADHAATRTSVLTITVTSAAGTQPGGVAGLPPNLSAPGVTSGSPLMGWPPNAQLPLIAPTPAVAAGASTTSGGATLRNVSSTLGFDDAFHRLVFTDVAWLTALLVSVSMILTQFRLHRRAARPARTRHAGGR